MFKKDDQVLFYSDSQQAKFKDIDELFKQPAHLGNLLDKTLYSGVPYWTIVSVTEGTVPVMQEKYMRLAREASAYNLVGGSGKYGNFWVYLAVGIVIILY